MHKYTKGIMSVCIFRDNLWILTEVANLLSNSNIGDGKTWVTPRKLEDLLKDELVFGILRKFTSEERWCDIYRR